jgi:transposase
VHGDQLVDHLSLALPYARHSDRPRSGYRPERGRVVHQVGDLDAWMTAATHSGIETLARFAQSLQQDLTAVKAGLTLPWSNGPVEGQITRLKLLKRQGYGRAGFALL